MKLVKASPNRTTCGNHWRYIGVAGAIISIVVLSFAVSCAEESKSETAGAGETSQELTIYVGPPTPFREAVSDSAIEHFATVSGFHLEFIQLNSWFVRVEGDPPIDLLDNLDMFINDDPKFYDSNPIRRRNRPDLILTSSWDAHIRTKAEQGYFSPVSLLFDFSPDFPLFQIIIL